MTAGLVLALASTTLISLAYLREHAAVAGMPTLSLRHPGRSVRLLVTNRPWLTGFAMESAGFALYVAALALAPLALVQSVAAGGVGILAVAGAHFAHRRMTNRELAGASVAVAGLVLLAVSLSGADSAEKPASPVAVAVCLGVIAGAAALFLTAGRAVLQRGVAAGIAGGLAFAAGDISTKVATEGGGRLLFAVPLIAGYLLGTSLLQIGYQNGAALTVAGMATLFTNAVPIAAGAIVLGEGVPTGALGAVRVAAFAAVTAGAVLLARPEPGSSPRRPSGQPAPARDARRRTARSRPLPRRA